MEYGSCYVTISRFLTHNAEWEITFLCEPQCPSLINSIKVSQTHPQPEEKVCVCTEGASESNLENRTLWGRALAFEAKWNRCRSERANRAESWKVKKLKSGLLFHFTDWFILFNNSLYTRDKHRLIPSPCSACVFGKCYKAAILCWNNKENS